MFSYQFVIMSFSVLFFVAAILTEDPEETFDDAAARKGCQIVQQSLQPRGRFPEIFACQRHISGDVMISCPCTVDTVKSPCGFIGIFQPL